MPSSPSSSALVLGSNQKSKLGKAFKLLKSHACKVANFTLLWQELEDHIRFIYSEIESKLQEHHPANETNRNDTNPPIKELILQQNKNPESKTSQAGDVSVKNGRDLILHIEHVKDHALVHGYLFKLFKAVDEPGKLVLDALKESCFLGDTEIRCCVVLLEEFGKVRGEIGDVTETVKEEAQELAVQWKGRLVKGNSLVALGFLLLLIDFELVSDFGFDEILKLFDCVSMRKQAPELFGALGFADKAPDYIQKLIAEGRRLEAVRYVYDFKLVDQFPPVPLLKDHARYAVKTANEIRKKGKNSAKAKIDAANSQITALRGIIRCIEKFQLESEYPSTELRRQIQRANKQKKERKKVTKIACSNCQSQKSDTNKRAASAQKTENKPKRNKSERTADLSAYANTSPPINLKQSTYHQQTSSYGGQGSQSSTLLARIDVPSQATANPHTQQSPGHAAHSLSHLSTVAQHLTSSFHNYNAGSTPSTTYPSLAARSYRFASSATNHRQTFSSPGPYERHIAANWSSGHFGSGSSHTPLASASNASTNMSITNCGDLMRTSMHYNRQASSTHTGIPSNVSSHIPSYYDRHVASSGNNSVSPRFPPSIYYP